MAAGKVIKRPVTIECIIWVVIRDHGFFNRQILGSNLGVYEHRMVGHDTGLADIAVCEVEVAVIFVPLHDGGSSCAVIYHVVDSSYRKIHFIGQEGYLCLFYVAACLKNEPSHLHAKDTAISVSCK